MNRVTAVIGLGVTAFAVTLAVYVGTRLSNEAMAVLTGAACGVSAMLPAAIIAGLALLRRREREDMLARTPPPPQSMYPPVIVVAPPTLNAPQPGVATPYTSPTPTAPRQFTIIGDDVLDQTPRA